MKELLEKRGQDYGDTAMQWGLAQRLKSILRLYYTDKSKTHVTMEALEMIMLKISRLVVGDESNLDTWDDIIGYATLARDDHAKFDNCQPQSAASVESSTTYELTLDGAQARIDNWITRIMPDRTPDMALKKLVMEEIPELLNGGLTNPLEWADVFILVLDCATLHGIDIIQAVHDKMAINERRTWAVNERGLLHHVGD